MAAKKHAVSGDQYRTIDQRMSEIKRQLCQKGGSPLDPECVAWILQQIVDGKRLVIADDTKASFKDTIMVPKSFSPAELVAKAKREISFTHCNPNLEKWNFLKMRDEKGEAIGRLDVDGIEYEVLSWTPGEHVTTEQVRDHFKALDADGNTALFVAWITKHRPTGYHASIPSKDELLWRDPESGGLCAPYFYRGDVFLELDLKIVNGGWGVHWVFVAFRAVSS